MLILVDSTESRALEVAIRKLNRDFLQSGAKRELKLKESFISPKDKKKFKSRLVKKRLIQKAIKQAKWEEKRGRR